jgi:hypothetical protein
MIRSIMAFVIVVAAAAGCSSTDTGSGASASCVASVPASCPSTTPSYQTDVAPVIATYCTSCHAAGGQESDKPLDTYAGVSARQGDVENELAGCTMPPSGSAQPTSAQIQAVLDWIACGAPNN